MNKQAPTTYRSIPVADTEAADMSKQSTPNLRNTRTPYSFDACLEAVLDLILALAPAYFFTFACVVYIRRGQPLDQHNNILLLEAARYGPTLFPIVFAAIIARFLRALAAIKLEHGTTVSTLEHLLQSRTVFSAVTAPFTLRQLRIAAPLLLALWSLSPLGGQASLRLVYTAPHLETSKHNFTYLAYVSGSFTGGRGSSAGDDRRIGIYSVFTASLMSPIAGQRAHQDLYGNIKIPLLNRVRNFTYTDTWKVLRQDEDVPWSSLVGLPVENVPASGVSRFIISTGYMVAACEVAGLNYSLPVNNGTGYGSALCGNARDGAYSKCHESGGNFAVSKVGPMIYGSSINKSTNLPLFPPVSFEFRATASGFGDSSKTLLTRANCSVTMEYVDVQIECNGRSCHSIAIRPSTQPATHAEAIGVGKEITQYYNFTRFTPINGLGYEAVNTMYFFDEFVNATNPKAGCSRTRCSPSPIESHLGRPGMLQGLELPALWRIGNDLFSERLTQLLNTFWIVSIAPHAVTGNFTPSVPSANQGVDSFIRTDSDMGTTQYERAVIQCDYAWLSVLLLASSTMLLCGLASIVLGMMRRGPDLLDRFGTLLRDNPYAPDPYYSSLEDSLSRSKRLADVKVCLGDVRPDDDVGYTAIAHVDDDAAVQRLRRGRMYA
ncbi:hypothetical protein PG989_006600 [Apiospora arundinis]